MLQAIRDRAQGIVVWTIVGLIIITFALFGLSTYLSGPSKIVVADINGTEISQNDLLRAQQNYLQRMQQLLGKQYDPAMFPDERVQREVLQGLITRALVDQHLNEAGYQVAFTQVLDKLRTIPAFQDNGSFSADLYKQVLRTQRMNPELFEQDLARDLASEQLYRGISQTAFVTPAELQRYAVLKNQQRNISYLTLDLADYTRTVQPTEQQIQDYYAANKQAFMTREQVSVDYLELDIRQMASQYDVSEADLKQYYDTHRANYSQQAEQRKASHILLKVDEQHKDTDVRQQADELLARLRNGEDFAKLAREYSQDPGSAKQGGDLGYFGKGIMTPPFEAAVFALQKGELSEPVKTEFGYHLIRLDDIRPEQLTPFEEVKQQIKTELQLQQAEQAYYEKADELNRYSYEMPDSLAGVADKMGLTLKQSPLFTRQGGPGLFADPKLVGAAFSEEVLRQGRNSEPVQLSDTHVVVLRVREHREARQKQLGEVKDQVTAQVRAQLARQQLEETATKIQQALEAGQAGEAVAKQYKLKWNEAGFIQREPSDKQQLDLALRQQAFQLPRPAGQAVTATVRLSNGNMAVMQLQAVRDGQAETDTARIKANQVRLASVAGSVSYDAFLDSLQQDADINITKQDKVQTE